MAASGIEYVNVTVDMAEALEELERSTFPDIDPTTLYDAAGYRALAEEFSEGCFAGFEPGDRTYPVAVGVGVRVHFDFDDPLHTFNEIVASGPGRSGDDPTGRWYYGTSIAVRPAHRRRGIGRELYELRKQVCRDLGLLGIVAGGVLPGFAHHKHAMTAAEYLDGVSCGRLYDPTLSFQIEQGFRVICPLPDYVIEPAVDNFAALIVWDHRSPG